MTTCTQNCAPALTQASPCAPQGLFAPVLQWLEIQRLKATIRQEREQLLRISEHDLSDLGITRAEAEAEARRRDIPVERLRMLIRRQC